MNEFSDPNAPVAGSGRRRTIIETFIDALIKPNEQTYTEISEDPGASANKAFLWVFISGTIAGLISGMLSLLFGNPFNQYLEMYGLSPQTSQSVGVESLFSTLCAAPISGVLAVISFAISVGIVQLIAKMLGGVGDFSKLAYGVAAFNVPIQLIFAPLSAIPVVNSCLCIFWLYPAYLEVLTIKVVHKLSWGKSILAAFGIVALLLFFACCIIGLLTLMGPIIGNVFSEINSNITP